MNFEDTVRMTAEWYRTFYTKPMEITSMTDQQIISYTVIAKSMGLTWAQ